MLSKQLAHKHMHVHAQEAGVVQAVFAQMLGDDLSVFLTALPD